MLDHRVQGCHFELVLGLAKSPSLALWPNLLHVVGAYILGSTIYAKWQGECEVRIVNGTRSVIGRNTCFSSSWFMRLHALLQLTCGLQTKSWSVLPANPQTLKPKLNPKLENLPRPVPYGRVHDR